MRMVSLGSGIAGCSILTTSAFILAILLLFFQIFSEGASAGVFAGGGVSLVAVQGPIVLYGPQRFDYQPGPARSVNLNFTIPIQANTPAALRVENGDGLGADRVTGAIVDLNGALVSSAKTFNLGSGMVDFPVVMRASNSLSVRITGNPGSYLTISVVIAAPLQIIALMPSTGAPGQSIMINGQGFDPRAPNQNIVSFAKAGGGLTQAQVTGVSVDKLSVIIPPDSATGPVTVQNVAGMAFSPADFVVSGGNQSPMVNAGPDQTITLPGMAVLNGEATDDGMPPGSSLLVSWSKLSGPGTVIFSNASGAVTNAIFGTSGVYMLRLTANDSLAAMSDDVRVTVNADPTPPPPDPSLVASTVNRTIATTIGSATEFLYTGANPIQTGVAPGTINPVRASVLKGRVLDRSNQPIPLVRVSVLDHPELGQTMTRADGRFDLAVNGGGVLTLKYEKAGYLSAQRTETAPWQDYCGVPDVVLIGYDPAVTFIDLLAATPIQVAQSTMSIDGSGTRRTTLMFLQGTTATMKLPGGAMAGLDKLHVRATEFTVGTNGFNAMPGDLPLNSGYTYAVDYSIDEAVAAGAVEVVFNQPVIQYNENFLDFPVGINIPSGAYDPGKGQWIPSDSGRVVKILSIDGGAATLDLDGGGQPATEPDYEALGISQAERQSLATLYPVNASLWRVPVIHFSKWDSNWPYGPPPDAEPPGGDPPMCDT